MSLKRLVRKETIPSILLCPKLNSHRNGVANFKKLYNGIQTGMGSGITTRTCEVHDIDRIHRFFQDFHLLLRFPCGLKACGVAVCRTLAFEKSRRRAGNVVKQSWEVKWRNCPNNGFNQHLGSRFGWESDPPALKDHHSADSHDHGNTV